MPFTKQATLARQTIGAAIFLALLGVLSSRMTTRAQAPAPVFANFEEAQTNPVRLSADGTRLFAVNTPNASLSVFDVTTPSSPILLAQIPVGLGPVSVNPRTDNEAWVVNQVSNSISVVSAAAGSWAKGLVTDTIYVKAEPMDVVFAGSNQAYISVSRNNEIAVVDAITHASISSLTVFGGNPRALAVSPDGTTVYAAFAISGNATTIIPGPFPQCGTAGQPQCNPPINPALPPPPKVALIVAASDPRITYKMPDNDVVAIKTGANPFVAGYYSGVGTINLGLAVSPVSGDLFVANTDALNITCSAQNTPVVCFEPNLRGHWVNNRITRIEVATGTITPFDLNPNIDYAILPNPQALKSALAQPAGVVFDPGGSFMYVASFGTDRVAQVDTNGNVLWFVEVSPPSGSGSNADPAHKRGPRGLALNANAQTLYSLNRISNSISVINTRTRKVTSELVVGTDPTPAALKAGRGFLYDAKLSGNGTGACASCHVDGDMDHLAWNLGDPTGSMTSTMQNGKTILFHPMKGPMTTQTLRGLLNLSPYHWRGDKPNFAAFNAAFDALMGGPQISNTDMTLYTDFASNILFQPNPYQTLERTLPTSLNGGDPVTGRNDFLTVAETGGKTVKVTCNACHTSNPGPGSNRVINLQFPQPTKTPELRNIYQKLLYDRFGAATIDGFGLAHDGSDSGLADFFSHALFNGYTATQKTDMAAYSLCFDTGTAPAVGFTLTLTAATVGSSSVQTDWATLQSQASAGNIDLIGRGTLSGVLHGLLYQPSSNNYISNTGTLYTQSALVQSLVQNHDTLSIMGVYPGTGSASTQP